MNGSFAIGYKEKGSSAILGGKVSCAKNQLDLIQAQRTLKKKEKKECIQEALGEFKFS